jgi:hypothetical protein
MKVGGAATRAALDSASRRNRKGRKGLSWLR